MKKLICALALAAAVPAMAEVQMSGFQPWSLVNGNALGADLLALDQIQSSPGGVKRVLGAHYFAQTMQFAVGEGAQKQSKSADYMVTVTDFQCSRPGSFRLRSEEYYVLGGETPTYTTGISTDKRWTVQGQGSVAFRLWEVVCKDVRDAKITPVSVIAGKKINITHDEVIGPVRAQIEQFKAQAPR